MTYAVVSGGFDPLHEGHVAYIQAAAKLGKVIVLLNSAAWLERKKGQAFMTYDSRAAVLSAISGVETVVPFNDRDGTVVDGLKRVASVYPGDFIFCKGGDRSDAANVPELEWCRANNVPVVLGCGGYTKANSSSELIKRAQG